MLFRSVLGTSYDISDAAATIADALIAGNLAVKGADAISATAGTVELSYAQADAVLNGHANATGAPSVGITAGNITVSGTVGLDQVSAIAGTVYTVKASVLDLVSPDALSVNPAVVDGSSVVVEGILNQAQYDALDAANGSGSVTAPGLDPSADADGVALATRIIETPNGFVGLEVAGVDFVDTVNLDLGLQTGAGSAGVEISIDPIALGNSVLGFMGAAIAETQSLKAKIGRAHV